MKKLIYVALLIGCASLLAACASSPVPTAQAKPVPSDRVFAPAVWLTPCSDCGRLVIKRDGGTMIGAGSSEHALLNGKKIADLWPGEKLTLHLPPGHYVLSATFVSWAGKPTVGFAISTGQTLVYRLTQGFMGQGPKIYASEQ